MSGRVRPAFGLLVLCALALTTAVGCESLQRKFTRRSKHPGTAPVPIVHFEDYTKAITPLDRYRKHYMMFDYWNDQLIAAFEDQHVSAKRVRRSSAEALKELELLHRELNDETAGRFEPILTERIRLDKTLQAGGYQPGQRHTIRRTLERQRRRINREFDWRDVEDQLQHDAQ